MLLTAFCLLIHSTIGSANIVFKKVQPRCNITDNTGCLRGQVCTDLGKCVLLAERANQPATSLPWNIDWLFALFEQQAPRSDGRCGKDFNGTMCDPQGPFGGCCSQSGWCGNTSTHCRLDAGCQAACAPNTGRAVFSIRGANKSIALIASESKDTPSSNAEEPVLGLPNASSSASAAGPVTSDGSCGANFGNAVCGNWTRGSCCSMYGYCGSSSTHCGDGCQSGPCSSKSNSTANLAASPAPSCRLSGSFRVVGDSGVPVMHAALMPNGRVVFLDKVENYTKLALASGRYAFSAEWDPSSNKIVPLAVKSNAFCSGGTFAADGTIINVGGNGPLPAIDSSVGDGFRAIRSLKRGLSNSNLDGQSWIEDNQHVLSSPRWYASAQTLGDGRIFVASGSRNGLDPVVPANNNPTYELLSSTGVPTGKSASLDILVRTQPYYMYPIIHLVRTGSLFIFTSKSSELWSPATDSAVAVYPDLPGDYRTYPNSGTSVLLPLSSANNWDPHVIICGGGAYQDARSPTDPSCGRIAPLAPEPQWEMDAMPQGRGMLDGVLLPDGSVLFINGANTGADGFGLASNPTLQALLYTHDAPLGKRWCTLATSPIPRLYHSVALLLLDGTVMLAGSNPNEQPILASPSSPPYPTEFRLEVFTPPYLADPSRRPTNLSLSSHALAANSSIFSLAFSVPPNVSAVKVALYHGGFVTHARHMGQRLLFLDHTGFRPGFVPRQNLLVSMPPHSDLAPPGPYVLYVVVDGVPGVGQFVMVE